MLDAFNKNAASDISPVRFGFSRHPIPARLSITPFNSAKTIDPAISVSTQFSSMLQLFASEITFTNSYNNTFTE